MFIPQEELDKLDESTPEESLSEHAETEEEEAAEEEVVEKSKEKVSSLADENDVADKARIPYSRFETVNERAIRAEERLKIIEEQIASSKQIESSQEVNVPDEWVELYGDSDAAKRAYLLQTQLTQKMREEATNEVLKSIEKKTAEKKQEEEESLKYIEQGLTSLATTLKRDLTDAEESAILDIQDEFTPKNEQGNYIAPLLAAEKAFEIYSLRNQTAKTSKSEARRKVVAITSAGNEIEGASATSAFENYRPGASGLWRKELN